MFPASQYSGSFANFLQTDRRTVFLNMKNFEIKTKQKDILEDIYFFLISLILGHFVDSTFYRHNNFVLLPSNLFYNHILFFPQSLWSNFIKFWHIFFNQNQKLYLKKICFYVSEITYLFIKIPPYLWNYLSMKNLLCMLLSIKCPIYVMSYL